MVGILYCRLDQVFEGASGALAAELVFDLQAPKKVTELSNVTVILDTPLILSLLDLSSRQNHEYAEKLVQSIKQVGAKLATYRHSVEEAEGVLQAVKNGLLFGSAYGPTADRIGSSTYRAFFETMIGKISQRLTENQGFEVIPPCANHFYQHFSQEDEEKLISRLHFSLFEKRLARERDALSVAETVRRRGGAHIPQHQVDASRYIFITSNSSLQKQAREFLINNRMLARDEFPPVITDRYFSGLLWLLFGGKSAEDLSTAKLLANCANALRLRQDVVQRTKRFLNTLDPNKAKHFEALMTSERAAQYMTEITLGDALLVTQENAERIYEQVEAIAAEKVAKQKDEEYGQQIGQIQEQLQTTTKLLQTTQTELDQAKLDRDVSQEQLNSVTDGLKTLRESLETQQRLAQEQLQQYTTLRQEFDSVRAQKLENERVIAQTRQQQVSVADQRSRQRVSILRILGVFLVAALVGLTGYIDKFYVPKLTPEGQVTGNSVVIILAVVTAVITLGVVVETIFGIVLRSVSRRAFVSTLVELGWSSEDATTKWGDKRNL